jgi:hypothetical protein
MKTLLHPTYFPSISQYAAIVQSEGLVFEREDNFQKQTNRNRMYIYSPNGIQLLNIPIKHSKTAHQKYKDIKFESAFNWQKQHFKSLEAAYRTSPFFEYFEDDIAPIFEKQYTFLFDLNIQLFEIINHCLGISIQPDYTDQYFYEVSEINDFRYLANGKKDTTVCESYQQVFAEKHGFINNLSILDLLFNEGRYALDYLKKQSL